MPIIFCDLETTGLMPEFNSILEIALVATDDNLKEIDRLSCVANVWVADKLAQMTEAERSKLGVEPIVYEMHEQNGLWRASAQSEHNVHDVDKMVAAWLLATLGAENLGERRGPQLAGNTINFDRAFLRRHMPLAHSALHYRNIDLSSLNEMARRFAPDLYAGRPGRETESNHRALGDVLNSLDLARYYAQHLKGTQNNAA